MLSSFPTFVPATRPTSVPTSVLSASQMVVSSSSSVPTHVPSGVPSVSPVRSALAQDGNTNAPTRVPTSRFTFAPTAVPSNFSQRDAFSFAECCSQREPDGGRCLALSLLSFPRRYPRQCPAQCEAGWQQQQQMVVWAANSLALILLELVQFWMLR